MNYSTVFDKGIIYKKKKKKNKCSWCKHEFIQMVLYNKNVFTKYDQSVHKNVMSLYI